MRVFVLFAFCLTAFNVSAGIISYNIDRAGNVIGVSENIRYYGDRDGYWALDGLNNTIRTSTGSFSHLNTSLFAVSDITDVTYSNVYNNMWVDIGGPTSYSVTRSGHVNSSSNSLRYFGDQNGYWILDDLNNTIRTSTGSFSHLNTSLFAVSDITDVTYSNVYNNMWVTVDSSPEQEVNEPSAFALLGLGIACIGLARRRLQLQS